MRYRFINNKLITGQLSICWTGGCLMVMAAAAIADSDGSRYSMQKVAEQSNPWALPQTPQKQPEYRSQPYQEQPYNQQHQQYQQAPEVTGAQPSHQWQPQTDRFVSPGFLESLKQQQQRYQIMPENQRYRQTAPRQYRPDLPGVSVPGQGGYGYPSYGAGSVNPLYDAPTVSPWGDGADVLYRGESFPMVPSEALGGLPPMHVPSFGVKNYGSSNPNEPGEAEEYKVFNPFTFLPQ